MYQFKTCTTLWNSSQYDQKTGKCSFWIIQSRIIDKVLIHFCFSTVLKLIDKWMAEHMHGRKWTNVLNCMKCALSSICTSVIWLQCALLSTNEWQSTCIVGKQIRLTLVIAIDLCHLDKLSRIYLRAFQPRAFQRQQNTRHSTDDAHQQHMFPYKPLRPILHQLLQACSLVQQIKKIKIKIKKVNATADEPRNLGEASLRLSVMRCRLNWHKKGAPYL